VCMPSKAEYIGENRMVRALLGQPVGVSLLLLLLSAPPPGVVVLLVSPPLSLLLLLSPPLLLPALELEVAELLLPPQPALNRTDPKARAHVSESTFRNIAMFDRCQSAGSPRHIDTCNHMNSRVLCEFSSAAESTKLARKM
jgi:hypothetical protein